LNWGGGLAAHDFKDGDKKGITKMNREFSVVIEKDEDGYFVASVPTLRGCHTQAKSLDVLMKRVKEAIELCLEVEAPAAMEFIGVQRVAVAE
jgi:predicted RNase H-like HicB family nuclease